MERRRFPVGIETFEKIRNNNFVYIDKTEYIHNLVEDKFIYFLSRPRRFGKSLLLSTIQAFFEGKRELFEGLKITRHNISWNRHPVFKINFVNADYSSENGLLSILEQQIAEWEKTYGLPASNLALPQRFYLVIKNAVDISGEQAVVLIDEYDKALVSTLDNPKLHDRFRNILKPIYATLKAADQYICFGMITGVSRFSRLSIFSDLNNLRDISFDEHYNAICGITEEELLTDCLSGIKRLSSGIECTTEETIAILKKNYDGYHFTKKSLDLYNPFSIFNAFEAKEIGSYWFATGTPTFLMKELRKSDSYLPDILNSEASSTELSNIDSYSNTIVPMLFQTGYLTVKGYDLEYQTYRLGLPNLEVANGFFNDLLPIYMDDKDSKSILTVRNFCRDVNAGKAEDFIIRLQAFLAGIPYDLSRNKPEVYFENNIFIIFKLMGFIVETEFRTSSGRIDLLVKTKDYIYVVELKLNGSAEDALRQIEEKGYALQFSSDPRKLYKIGISFSKKTRNIDSWIIRQS